MIKYSTIRLADLRRIIDVLLTDAERKIGPVLQLDHDYYWDISSPELYDLATKTGDLKEVGSLGDDWEFLHAIESSSEGPYQTLVHVAPILRYLADKPGA